MHLETRGASAWAMGADTFITMPNWCENYVTITGPAGSLQTFRECLGSETIAQGEDRTLLGTFLPRPVELDGTSMPNIAPFSQQAFEKASQGYPAAGADELASMQAANDAWAADCAELVRICGYDNWYDWSTANWGTKWTDDLFNIEYRPRSVAFGMTTAWAPPIAGLVTISAVTGLTIRNRWFEAGMGMKGIFAVRAGVVERDDVFQYRGYRGG